MLNGFISYSSSSQSAVKPISRSILENKHKGSDDFQSSVFFKNFECSETSRRAIAIS